MPRNVLECKVSFVPRFAVTTPIPPAPREGVVQAPQLPNSCAMYRYRCFHAVVASLIALAVVQTAGAAPVVTPFNAACPSPVPDSSTYNKLIPDRTEIPLPMTVSLQPIMVTDISPRCAAVRVPPCRAAAVQ